MAEARTAVTVWYATCDLHEAETAKKYGCLAFLCRSTIEKPERIVPLAE